jgi:hypothetical protein
MVLVVKMWRNWHAVWTFNGKNNSEAKSYMSLLKEELHLKYYPLLVILLITAQLATNVLLYL